MEDSQLRNNVEPRIIITNTTVTLKGDPPGAQTTLNFVSICLTSYDCVNDNKCYCIGVPWIGDGCLSPAIECQKPEKEDESA